MRSLVCNTLCGRIYYSDLHAVHTAYVEVQIINSLVFLSALLLLS